MSLDYNQLAEQYKEYRKPDPRIAARIWNHTKASIRVLNVGAGRGAYEPENCEVIAIDPSREMIASRNNSATRVLQGQAENLPFEDDEFDVSMAILTIHHWSDIQAGLREMSRVTKQKLVLLTWVGYSGNFWLEDYLPEIRGVDEKLFPSLSDLTNYLGEISVEDVDIPHDCTDGFMCAYWRRPESYLNPGIRKAISTFSRIPDVSTRLEALRVDIANDAWNEKYSYLLNKEFLDLGYRLVIHQINNA